MTGTFGFCVSSPAARAAAPGACDTAGRKARTSRKVSAALTDFLTRVLAGRGRSMTFLLAEATPKFRVGDEDRKPAGNRAAPGAKAPAVRYGAAHEARRRYRGDEFCELEFSECRQTLCLPSAGCQGFLSLGRAEGGHAVGGRVRRAVTPSPRRRRARTRWCGPCRPRRASSPS